MRCKNLLLGAALATMVSAPAWAQEQKPAEETVAPSPTPESDAAEPGAAEAQAPSDATQPATMTKPGAPFPRISDSEETIYAVQRKAFVVKKRFETALMFGFSFTDRFSQSLGLAGAVTYHIGENLGLELFGDGLFSSTSGLTDQLKTAQLLTEIARLTQMLWGAGLGLEWSPIYGKLELFGASLGNFNFFLNAGLGIGQSRGICAKQNAKLDPEMYGQATCPELASIDPNTVDPNSPPDTRSVYAPARTHLMGALGGGARFYFTNWLGLRIEVRDWVYPARMYFPGPSSSSDQNRFTDSIRNNILVNVGVSYLFGGED